MWYALAKNQDYFAPRVNRFVAIAACIFAELYSWGDTFEKASYIFYQLEKNGFYNGFGEDETGINFGAIECYAAGGDRESCADADGFTKFIPDWDVFEFNAESVGALLYFAQLSFELRF